MEVKVRITSKKLRYGSNAIIFILIILGILVLINFLSTRYFARADLTENNIYTLSQSTKKIVEELDDIVSINVYFSKEPPRVANIRRKVRDVLDEYRAFSHGNLRIDFIDPGDDKKLKQKLRFMGIPELQVNIVEKDKQAIAKVYMGIAVLYEDKKEVLPVVQNTGNLEYDLTSAILKVSQDETKTAGFLTGHGEIDIDSKQYQPLKRELQKQYDVKKVNLEKGQNALSRQRNPRRQKNPNLEEGENALENIDTLIVAGPKEKVSEREKYLIDQFLMRGGKGVFLIDPIKLREGSLRATPLATGLNGMLANYGVKLSNSLILDRSRANATFSGGRMRYSIPYPYWPKVIKKNFSAEHVITNQLESLVLPWVSALEITVPEKGNKKGKESPIKVTRLAKTTEYGWSVQSPYNLNPQQQSSMPEDTKQFTLAVALSGNLKSFYAGKEIPKPQEAGGSETSTYDKERITESQKPTQIVVVGNSGFMRHPGDNQTFFQNIVDWMTLGDKLIGIRSHTVTDRPLQELSSGGKTFVKFLGTFVIPIIVVIAGLLRLYLKRRAKRLFESYGQSE